MSFYVAVATSDLALMAADTRLRYPGLGDLIDDRPKRRKLRRLRGGWATGSSFLSQWLDLVYEEIGAINAADVGSIATAIRAVRAGDRFRALETLGGYREALATRPAGAQEEIGDLVVVARAADGFTLTAYDDTGLATQAPPARFYWNTLSEIDPKTLGALLLRHLGGAQASECALFRKIGACFAEIFTWCGPEGSISPRVEIALMMRDADGQVVHRHVSPRSSAELAEADDAVLVPWIEVEK